MKKTGVIISTNGPLHFMNSAIHLAPFVNLKIIQGWVPRKVNSLFIKFLGKVVGRDITKGLNKRSQNILVNNKSIAIPEFYYRFGKHFFKKDFRYEAARMYGFISSFYLKDFDVLHVRSGSGLSAISKARRFGAKIIVDHSIAHPNFMDLQLRGEYKGKNQKFLFSSKSDFWYAVLNDCYNSDCLLVNSDFVKKTFVEEGFDESKIHVIYLGVRSDFFYLKENFTSSSKFRILFTGTFGLRKGSSYILEAAKLLKLDSFDFEIIIVGSYSEVSHLIDEYTLYNIKFVGHVPQDELKEYLIDSDVYLFPSLCEGCASSGMEAMAAGLPVIATIESGLPIDHEENGIIVPSKNSEAIASSIMKLASSSDLRRRIGTCGADKISNNFTWEKYVSNVLELYNKILKE